MFLHSNYERTLVFLLSTRLFLSSQGLDDFVLGINRTRLCVHDACWLPLFIEKQTGVIDTGNGECVMRYSYKANCNAFIDAKCFYCAKEPSQEGEGYGLGTNNCDQSSADVNLDKPPASMVYSGVSGRWWLEAGKFKANQLLCDGLHPCRCGDDNCLSSLDDSASEPRCIDFLSPSTNTTSVEETCCTSGSRNYLLLSPWKSLKHGYSSIVPIIGAFIFGFLI
uniref:Uncharacterized protein n=1 Tax=Eucampia antarctica TaxID=49252 RepID=A0A7S2R4M6_9STRA|mmetsp:Transcript_1679/g.1598  ORF Transcript_1679/g.1598 Transcript_1679/m.1598 type:complete len:223 (+) Transcript_1679:100-768(+)